MANTKRSGVLTRRLSMVVVWSASAGAAQCECRMNRAVSLPITLWDQKLYVPVTINGTTLRLFVDTGASVTTLSQAAADALNLPRDFDRSADILGVAGAESRLTLVGPATLALGTLQLTLHTIPVAAFGERLADGTLSAGLIGADILGQFDLDIDIPGRRLALWRVSDCARVTPDWIGASGSAPLQIDVSGHASLPVRVDDAQVQLTLDTGSPALVLSTRAAARAGAALDQLEESRPLTGKGVNDRAFSAWPHIFARLDVAGQSFAGVRGVVVSPGRLDRGGDGLLGLEYLKRGRVWVSYSTGQFFVQSRPE